MKTSTTHPSHAGEFVCDIFGRAEWRRDNASPLYIQHNKGTILVITKQQAGWNPDKTSLIVLAAKYTPFQYPPTSNHTKQQAGWNPVKTLLIVFAAKLHPITVSTHELTDFLRNYISLHYSIRSRACWWSSRLHFISLLYKICCCRTALLGPVDSTGSPGPLSYPRSIISIWKYCGKPGSLPWAD